MSYSVWNDKLLNYFFGSFASNQSVRITVTEELLDSEFEELGGFSSFKKALVKGPEWPAEMRNGLGSDPQTFLGRSFGLFEQWQRGPRHHEYIEDSWDGPPFFNYLCALCLAWTLESNEFTDAAFYPRLELIYPEHGLGTLRMKKLASLWEGLENWTKRFEFKNGKFEVECLGHNQHVGLPKSQVILTPGKIEKTPELFYDLALSPDDLLNQENLRQRILSEFDPNSFLLGRYIYSEINQSSELGISALNQLLDYFQAWDGHVPYRFNNASAASRSEKSEDLGRAGIVAGLRYLPDLNSWLPVRMAHIPELPDGELKLVVNDKLYISQIRNGVGEPLIHQDGESAFELLFADIEAHAFLPISWCSEYEGEREVVCAIKRPSPIQCFNWTATGECLIQLPALPSEGYAYALVQSSFEEHFKSWCEESGVKHTTELPQSGLGADERLFHVEDIGNATPEQWAMFPDGGDSKRKRPRRMTLIGGSRQRREKAQKTYLPFDPPNLKIEAQGNVSFDLKNCELEEVSHEAASLPSWVKPNSSTKIFEITPTSGTNRVQITANREAEIIGQVSFRILNRDDLEPVEAENYKLNRLGLKEECEFKEGVNGVIVPAATQYEFEEGPYSTWPKFDANQDSTQNIFMDWLSSQKSVPYNRLSNFCTRRLSVDLRKTNLANEIKSLFNLGHLEIQIDSRGRWSYVHATKPALYPLPYLADGKFQFVLGGCYPSSLVQRVARECNRVEELELDCHPQLGDRRFNYRFVPNRITVFADSINDVVNLGRAIGIHVCDSPPSWDIANWCAGTDQWQEQLRWHIGEMAHADASYDPPLYRTKVPANWPKWGDYNLVRTKDSQTKKHFSYSLVKREQDEFLHALCGHKTWGTWLTHRHMLTTKFPFLVDEGIPIAYEPVERLLILPLELDPPPLFTRALSLCSGFASRRVSPEEYGAYLDQNFGFKYEGPCIAYPSVPKTVADLLLEKLGAKSKNFCNNECGSNQC